MMEVAFVVGAAIGFLLGLFVATTRTGQIKEENARLNAELHKLTDRDSKGRFRGGK
jgi:ABC-type methionine transport system permease subunit